MTDLVHVLNTERMRDLSEPAREALLATALSARAMVPMFAALGLDSALVEIESNGMVHVIGGRVLFVHPLPAAADSPASKAPLRPTLPFSAQRPWTHGLPE